MDEDNESLFICKCECGGNVIGVQEFERLFTYCDRCSRAKLIKVAPDTNAETNDD